MQPPVYQHVEVDNILFDAAKVEIFYTLTKKEDREKPKIAVLNIAALQRLPLHKLQQQIAEETKGIYSSQTDYEYKGDVLHSYCKHYCLRFRKRCSRSLT